MDVLHYFFCIFWDPIAFVQCLIIHFSANFYIKAIIFYTLETFFVIGNRIGSISSHIFVKLFSLGEHYNQSLQGIYSYELSLLKLRNGATSKNTVESSVPYPADCKKKLVEI